MSLGSITILAPANITKESIAGLLCCAFEGGSNYWYCDLDISKLPTGYARDDFKEGGRCEQENGTYWHWCQLVPLMEGGELSFGLSAWPGTAEGRKTLDLAKIKRGLAVFREKCPGHYADWVSENDDADTGDAFLQCAALGEVVYG